MAGRRSGALWHRTLGLCAPHSSRCAGGGRLVRGQPSIERDPERPLCECQRATLSSPATASPRRGHPASHPGKAGDLHPSTASVLRGRAQCHWIPTLPYRVQKSNGFRTGSSHGEWAAAHGSAQRSPSVPQILNAGRRKAQGSLKTTMQP